MRKTLPYEELPPTYVIFICDYDPFDAGKYCYTVKPACEEAPQLDVSAGLHTIFLSTKGENDNEVSKELVNFLKYIGSELKSSEDDFGDSYVMRLQETVRKIKRDREMGERYMVFEEMLRDERKEGIEEGIEKGLEALVNTLQPILGDFDKVYDQIRRNEVYANITPEMVKKYYK